MNKLQEVAYANPFAGTSENILPKAQRIGGGMAIALSLNR